MILGGGGGGGRLSKSKSEEAEVGSWVMPFGSDGEKLILAPLSELFIKLKCSKCLVLGLEWICLNWLDLKKNR